MGAHVNNLNDYVALIREQPAEWCSALRIAKGSVGFENAQWEYRAAEIKSGHIWGCNLHEKWLTSTRLNTIMNAMARRIIKNTNAQLGDDWKNRNTPRAVPQSTVSAGYVSHRMLAERRP